MFFIPESASRAVPQLAVIFLLGTCIFGQERAPVYEPVAQSQAAPAASGWVTVNSREGGFSVQLPGRVQKFTRPFKFSGGEGVLHGVRGTEDQSTAEVTWAENEDEEAPDAEASLKEIISGKPPQYKVEYELDVRVGRYPGKKVLLNSDGPKQIQMLVLPVGHRLYVLRYEYIADYLAKLSVQSFFDSFRLTGSK